MVLVAVSIVLAPDCLEDGFAKVSLASRRIAELVAPSCCWPILNREYR